MFTTIEASDGSAQPATQSGVSEFRDLLNAAKGVTPDQLELQLARGHLKEAARAFEVMRGERDQLLDRLKNAAATVGELEAENAKARKVIAGNTGIKDNGSLLDMLNGILSSRSLAVANLAHAGEKIAELYEYIRIQGGVNSGDSTQR